MCRSLLTTTTRSPLSDLIPSQTLNQGYHHQNYGLQRHCTLKAISAPHVHSCTAATTNWLYTWILPTCSTQTHLESTQRRCQDVKRSHCPVRQPGSQHLRLQRRTQPGTEAPHAHATLDSSRLTEFSHRRTRVTNSANTVLLDSRRRKSWRITRSQHMPRV